MTVGITWSAIVFTSDNGMLWGEHRQRKRRRDLTHELRRHCTPPPPGFSVD